MLHLSRLFNVWRLDLLLVAFLTLTKVWKGRWLLRTSEAVTLFPPWSTIKRKRSEYYLATTFENSTNTLQIKRPSKRLLPSRRLKNHLKTVWSKGKPTIKIQPTNDNQTRKYHTSRVKQTWKDDYCRQLLCAFFHVARSFKHFQRQSSKAIDLLSGCWQCPWPDQHTTGKRWNLRKIQIFQPTKKGQLNTKKLRCFNILGYKTDIRNAIEDSMHGPLWNSVLGLLKEMQTMNIGL